MDYITGLPELGKHNGILVVMPRLSKMAKYITTYRDIHYVQVACLDYDTLFRLYRLPDSIVSKGGTHFTFKLS